ncbi:MAG: hypothetical protein GY811_06045 [Myxococcales bacterium]|nr:hypothetical protein [Myxococcales bacterium]
MTPTELIIKKHHLNVLVLEQEKHYKLANEIERVVGRLDWIDADPETLANYKAEIIQERKTVEQFSKQIDEVRKEINVECAFGRF